MDYGKESAALSGTLMDFGLWRSGYCESFHSWKYALDNMAFLPFDLLEHLGMQHDGTKRKIHAALMDAVVEMANGRSAIPWDDTTNTRSSCNRVAIAISTYTHMLLKLGILPGVPNEGAHTHMSPGQLIRMIEETEFPSSPFKERGICSRLIELWATECPWSGYKDFDMKKHLLKELKGCIGGFDGLGLACVKYQECQKHPRGLQNGSI
ncbi:hypothetical protein BDV19DRAFT_386356 [Aspergillus venezuelensis]